MASSRTKIDGINRATRLGSQVSITYADAELEALAPSLKP